MINHYPAWTLEFCSAFWRSAKVYFSGVPHTTGVTLNDKIPISQIKRGDVTISNNMKIYLKILSNVFVKNIVKVEFRLFP